MPKSIAASRAGRTSSGFSSRRIRNEIGGAFEVARGVEGERAPGAAPRDQLLVRARTEGARADGPVRRALPELLRAGRGGERRRDVQRGVAARRDVVGRIRDLGTDRPILVPTTADADELKRTEGRARMIVRAIVRGNRMTARPFGVLSVQTSPQATAIVDARSRRGGRLTDALPGRPFPHVVIDGFLDAALCRRLVEFPATTCALPQRLGRARQRPGLRGRCRASAARGRNSTADCSPAFPRSPEPHLGHPDLLFDRATSAAGRTRTCTTWTRPAHRLQPAPRRSCTAG